MKFAKGFKGKYFSVAAIFRLSTQVCAASLIESQIAADENAKVKKPLVFEENSEKEAPIQIGQIVVESKKIQTSQLNAPYAVEIYTQEDIASSHSKDIYEFLNSQTSIKSSPSYGNTLSQNLDLRGYGFESGYQNIAVIVDGRKINNIDMSPPNLSSISINNIEKIEILKGGGSVEYGDGAMGGAIVITTKKSTGLEFGTFAQSNGTRSGTISGGFLNEYFHLGYFFDNFSSDGGIKIQNKEDGGECDAKDNRNKNFDLTIFLTQKLNIKIGKNYNNGDVFYANALKKEAFYENVILGTRGYTKQNIDSQDSNYGLDYEINENFIFDLNFANGTKQKSFNNLNPASYKSDYLNPSLKYQKDNLKLFFGAENSKQDREQSAAWGLPATKIEKNANGYFAKSDFSIDRQTFSIGARGEKIEYEYNEYANQNVQNENTQNENENNQKKLSKDEDLTSWEAGYNYQLDDFSSIFASVNSAFATPDIDRFFKAVYDENYNYDHTEFNSFIEPSKVKTINFGYNRFEKNNKLKLSLFYSSLKNEIYFEPLTWSNSNIDEGRKFGFEIYDRYDFTDKLYFSGTYNFVDSEILKEENNPQYERKEIPQVSKHNFYVGVGYEIIKNLEAKIFHTQKSNFYYLSDFENKYTQKGEKSTDFTLSYGYKNFEFYAKVQNIFDEKNAIYTIGGDGGEYVYPSNFERVFLSGFKAKF